MPRKRLVAIATAATGAVVAATVDGVVGVAVVVAALAATGPHAWPVVGAVGAAGVTAGVVGVVDPVHVGAATTVFLAANLRQWWLEHQAATDPVTGIANRRGARLHTCRGPVGVVYVDLDGFKEVNDRYGHDTGDEVLRLVARRLDAATRRTDRLVTPWQRSMRAARLGGDEFLIVAGNDDTVALQRLAQRIRTDLDQLLAPWGAGASVGVETADNLAAAQRVAEQRMYAAKAARTRRHRHDPVSA